MMRILTYILVMLFSVEVTGASYLADWIYPSAELGHCQKVLCECSWKGHHAHTHESAKQDENYAHVGHGCHFHKKQAPRIKPLSIEEALKIAPHFFGSQTATTENFRFAYSKSLKTLRIDNFEIDPEMNLLMPLKEKINLKSRLIDRSFSPPPQSFFSTII